MRMKATSAASCGTENLCIFMKIVEQVRLYLDSREIQSNQQHCDNCQWENEGLS